MACRKRTRFTLKDFLLIGAIILAAAGLFTAGEKFILYLDKKIQENAINKLEAIIENNPTIKLDGKTVQSEDIHPAFYMDNYFYDAATNTLFITVK